MNKLYPEIIKTHNASPFHFEKISNPQFTLKAYNPICGDRFELYVGTNQGKIERIYFNGFGCAISKASTSIMAKTLSGLAIKDALELCDNFLDFIHNKSKTGSTALSDDFLAFSAVHEFPERTDCAILSWKEMKNFLELNSE